MSAESCLGNVAISLLFHTPLMTLSHQARVLGLACVLQRGLSFCPLVPWDDRQKSNVSLIDIKNLGMGAGSSLWQCHFNQEELEFTVVSFTAKRSRNPTST